MRCQQMAQAGADQHQRRVAIWESAHHTGTPSNFPVDVNAGVFDPKHRPEMTHIAGYANVGHPSAGISAGGTV